MSGWRALSVVILSLVGKVFASEAPPLFCKKVVAAKPEKSQFLVPEVITWDWILREVLIGPEVTFTNRHLETMDTVFINPWTDHPPLLRVEANAEGRMATEEWITKASPNISKAAQREILKLLFDVLPTKTITAERNQSQESELSHTHSPGTLRIRTNTSSLHFRVLTEDGRTLLVHPEPGAIEINQAPTTLDKLGSIWSDIFERAEALGFSGTRGPTYGGGGGHIHLGFKDRRLDLFLARPDILADFALFPIVHPSTMFLLRESSEYHQLSASESPLDNPTIPREISDFENLTKMEPTHSKGIRPSIKSLRDIMPHSLTAHDSYISLKNYFRKGRKQRSSVEVRYPRAFNSFDDLYAAALLQLKIINFATEKRATSPIAENYNYHTLRYLQKDWQRVQYLLDLDESHATQIRYYGGADLFATYPSRKNLTGVLKNIRVRVRETSAEAIPVYEIAIPRSKKQRTDPSAIPPSYLNGHRRYVVHYSNEVVVDVLATPGASNWVIVRALDYPPFLVKFLERPDGSHRIIFDPLDSKTQDLYELISNIFEANYGVVSDSQRKSALNSELLSAGYSESEIDEAFHRLATQPSRTLHLGVLNTDLQKVTNVLLLLVRADGQIIHVKIPFEIGHEHYSLSVLKLKLTSDVSEEIQKFVLNSSLQLDQSSLILNLSDKTQRTIPPLSDPDLFRILTAQILAPQ